MLVKIFLALVLMFTVTQVSAKSHFSYSGYDGSYAYFTVNSVVFVGSDRTNLIVVDGVVYTPGTGLQAVGNIDIYTDRFGMVHPSTGIQIGIFLSNLRFFVDPGTLGTYPNFGTDFGSYGLYPTYAGFNKVFNPNGNPYGDYSVAGLPQAGTLGISDGAVPEPAVWALMIVGFGAVGIASRRRRETVTA